jgi:transcription initiation factor TFIIE subunit alpha
MAMKKRKNTVKNSKRRTVKKAKKTKKTAVKKEKKIIIDTNKLLRLEEARKYVIDVAGEKGLEVFEFLIAKGEMEENLLAKKLKFEKANAIRKFLYRLYNKNLVSYRKIRKNNKAWYTYFWSANPEKLVFIIREMYEEEIKQTKKSMELNKAEDFYVCDICNRRYDINEALQNDFRCKNDGGVLTHIESGKVLEDKQSRIDFLNKKLNELKQLVK